ncbi:unnamed protein product [Blepharisma stoltei]|uniref:Uncharacterized protein n=1 Tax=Blepharisma stoltei TaxID=1481888 RepID=A0AAU9IGD3_9CILI|nr:unnamed protein product [Blepharisma stoltei]
MNTLAKLQISEDSKIVITPIIIILRIILEPTLLYLLSSQRQQQFLIEYWIFFQCLLYATEFLNLFDRYSHKFANFNITGKFPFLLSIYILFWTIFYKVLIEDVLLLDAALPIYILFWTYTTFLLSLVGYFLKELFETAKFSFHAYALFVLMLAIKEVSLYSWYIINGFIYFLFRLCIFTTIITGVIGAGAQFLKIFYAQFSSTHDFIKASKVFINDWLASDTKGLAKCYTKTFEMLFKMNGIIQIKFDKAFFLKNTYLIEWYLNLAIFWLAFLLPLRDGFSHCRRNEYIWLNAFAMLFMAEMIYHCLALILGL